MPQQLLKALLPLPVSQDTQTFLYRNRQDRASGAMKDPNFGLHHYLLQEFNREAHHGWMINKVKAFESLHSSFTQQFIIHTKTLRMNILLECICFPQTAHHSY